MTNRTVIRRAARWFALIAPALCRISTLCVCARADQPFAEHMRDRWFYLSYNLNDDAGADRVVELVERAGKVQLNGMLWAAPWDRADEWSDVEIARFEKIKSASEQA